MGQNTSQETRISHVTAGLERTRLNPDERATIPASDSIESENLASLKGATKAIEPWTGPGDDADFSIVLFDGSELKAHRSVLETKCEFFKALFESDWADSKTDRFTLDRPSSKAAVSAFLRYLYTGSLEASSDLSEYAELFELAKFFSVSTLSHELLSLVDTVPNLIEAARLLAEHGDSDVPPSLKDLAATSLITMKDDVLSGLSEGTVATLVNLAALNQWIAGGALECFRFIQRWAAKNEIENPTIVVPFVPFERVWLKDFEEQVATSGLVREPLLSELRARVKLARDFTALPSTPSLILNEGLTNALGVYFDPVSELVWVSNSGPGSIHAFKLTGQKRIAFGSQGSGPGQFDHPCGVAVSFDGHVFVSDTLNHRIQKFTSDGKFVCKFGSEGSAPGQLRRPDRIGIDHFRKRVHVCDNDNNRVSVFSEEGTFLSTYGRDILRAPVGIAVDGERGRVYISDAFGEANVKVFSTEGKLLSKIGHNERGRKGFLGSGGFGRHVAVDSTSGNLLVADTSCNRIVVFSPSGEWVGDFQIDARLHGGDFARYGIMTVAVSSTKGEIFVACRDKGVFVF